VLHAAKARAFRPCAAMLSRFRGTRWSMLLFCGGVCRNCKLPRCPRLRAEGEQEQTATAAIMAATIPIMERFRALLAV